ncbi:MAG: ferritin-like domain-containing protein [Syntrophobacteraceae bacterium]
MTDFDMAKELSELVELDIEAAHAYGQAITIVTEPGIRDRLARFQKDHERHIEQLSAVIRALDAEPPAYAWDLKSTQPEEVAPIAGMMGTEGTISTMKTKEVFANKTYREAQHLSFTPNIGELVRRNYQDEQVHLNYLEEVLAARSWER